MDKKLPPYTNYCLCSECGRYFGGVTAFELHRVRVRQGDGEKVAICAQPSALVTENGTPKMRLSRDGYWIRAYSKK